jgi:hypothetical protein
LLRAWRRLGRHGFAGRTLARYRWRRIWLGRRQRLAVFANGRGELARQRNHAIRLGIQRAHEQLDDFRARVGQGRFNHHHRCGQGQGTLAAGLVRQHLPQR